MDKPTIVVMLQNAWSTLYTYLECGIDPPNNHRFIWDRQGWLAAFQRSRSGQRWRLTADRDGRWGSGVAATIDGFPVWFDNTTPMIAKESSGVHRPDPGYIEQLLGGELLLDRKPSLVVACGKQAAAAAGKIWRGSFIAMPHPANRVLTNEVFTTARRVIIDVMQSPLTVNRLQIVQNRGSVACKYLEAERV